jgi:hypothetical protein
VNSVFGVEKAAPVGGTERRRRADVKRDALVAVAGAQDAQATMND